MPAAIALLKFVGVGSVGLLTGVSYTLSTQTLPSLLTLPSAKPAARTLHQTTRLATLHIRTLSTLASASLLLAFALSPSRIRHPYLLWTALVAGGAGALNLVTDQTATQPVITDEVGEFNGEQVEKRARDQQRLEFLRTFVSGLAFTMGVVGIWGDGA